MLIFRVCLNIILDYQMQLFSNRSILYRLCPEIDFSQGSSRLNCVYIKRYKNLYAHIFHELNIGHDTITRHIRKTHCVFTCPGWPGTCVSLTWASPGTRMHCGRRKFIKGSVMPWTMWTAPPKHCCRPRTPFHKYSIP